MRLSNHCRSILSGIAFIVFLLAVRDVRAEAANNNSGKVKAELATVELSAPQELLEIFINSTPFDAKPLKVVMEGAEGEMVYHGNPRGLRAKHAQRQKKFSLRISFADKKGQAASRHIVFRAETQDKSFLREWIGYKMFAEAGILSPEAKPVRLKVNNEEIGIYLEVEPVDEHCIQQRFPQRADSFLLYYGDTKMDRKSDIISDLTPALDLSEYPIAYTPVMNRTDEQFRELDALLRKLNAVPFDFRKLEESADIEEWASWFAVSEIMENSDSMWRSGARNYSLLRAPGGKWQILPWDLDRIYENNDIYFPVSKIKGLKQLMNNPLFSQRVRAKVKELIHGKLSEEVLLKWISDMEPVLEPAITAGYEQDLKLSQWEMAMKELKQNVIVRHKKLKSLIR